jgi:hypothetical protein
MCESERYNNRWKMSLAPVESVFKSSLFVGKREVFSVRLTRKRVVATNTDTDELVAQVGAPSTLGLYRLSPMHISATPVVCWIPMDEIDDDDLKVFHVWRADKKLELDVWLSAMLLSLGVM